MGCGKSASHRGCTLETRYQERDTVARASRSQVLHKKVYRLLSCQTDPLVLWPCSYLQFWHTSSWLERYLQTISWPRRTLTLRSLCIIFFLCRALNPLTIWTTIMRASLSFISMLLSFRNSTYSCKFPPSAYSRIRLQVWVRLEFLTTETNHWCQQMLHKTW